MIRNFEDVIKLAEERETMGMAVAVAEDREVLKSVKKATDKGLVSPTLIGNEEKINQISKEIDFDLTNVNIINELDDKKAAKKAVKIVNSGESQILMKGLVGTGTILSEVLNKNYGLRTGKVLSQVTMFDIDTYPKIFFLTDPAMNIAPDLDGKKEILENAVEVAHALDIEKPKVAALAAVENVNDAMPATHDANNLKQMNQDGEIKDCVIDGPLALDNAISKESARIKNIGGEVAGNADILLAPNIESGNMLYKSLTFLGGAKSAGILVGAAAPIVLTSRADDHNAKFNSIALAVLLASK